MPNPYLLQRLNGLRTILNGVHQSSVGLSSATTGTERAAFINDFLAKVLPPVYRFGSGDATDAGGSRSGQLDVVIEYPFSPTLPSVGTDPTRLYLAEGVAAVVEVKSNLANQWGEAVHTARALAPLARNFSGFFSMGMTPTAEVPCFAVGYTGWKTLDTLRDHVMNCPEIFGALVIDSGFYVSRRTTGTGPLSLWALICDLHAVTTSLQSAQTDPSAYAI